MAQAKPAEPFTLLTASPPDRSHGAARDVQPRLTFSQAIDPTSVGSSPVALTRPGHLVYGQGSPSGADLRVTHGQRLLPLAEYRMEIRNPLRSVTGVPLSGPTSTVFTTTDGQWREPAVAHDGASFLASGLEVQSVQIGGDALVAWHSTGEPGIRVSHYSDIDKRWSAPQLVTGQGGVAAEPQLVADGQGNAILVWSHLNAWGYNVVWAARFNGATRQWLAPRVVSHADGSHNTAPQVASDGAGRVVVAWRRTDGTRDSVWWTQGWSSQSFNWSVPSRADSAVAPAGPIGSLAVGLSPHFNRMVLAWSARTNTVNTVPAIWARAFGLYVPAGHAEPRVISNANGDPLVEPSVTVDAAGTGWVAWRQYGPGPTAYPTFSNVQVTRIDGYGWQPAVWVSDLYAQARHVRIASNRAPFGAERTWLTWVEPQRGGAVFAAQVTTSGVASVSMLGVSAIDGYHRSNLAVDNAGNVMVAWGQQASTATLMAARYAARTGAWGAPVNLDARAQPGSQAFGASLSVNTAGDLFAAWLSIDVDPLTGGARRTPALTRRFD
jgi:hypothetical protein